jgi:hypothetical protein
MEIIFSNRDMERGVRIIFGSQSGASKGSKLQFILERFLTSVAVTSGENLETKRDFILTFSTTGREDELRTPIMVILILYFSILLHCIVH